jgi:transposase
VLPSSPWLKGIDTIDPTYYTHDMAMGRRKDRARTPGLWIATNELPRTGGHPFYQRLNQVLDAHAFDAFAEAQCAPFYADGVGRPGLTPGTYFRLLLIGYFEGIDSERGIAWRTADSLALRGFLGLGLDETPPEHSTISRTRRLIDVETHRAIFTWILQVLATADLVKGKTIGIDATTLEANAALRSIVRRDSGETYQEFLTRLAQASGIETPTRADLARLDRKRPKKGRNSEWRHPHDPDARITKMKDGRTHLAHKAEHAVDLETGAVVGVTVQGADQGDTTTIAETLTTAAEELEAVAAATDGETSVIDEVVGDKGYHSNQVLVDLVALDLRTYIAEPDRGQRKWKKKLDARDAVYANRRRIRGTRGLALQRRRSERLERPNAHLYETGGMRRTHLRGHTNILKRLLVHIGGFNLGLLMRTLIGVGTPRGLQGQLAALIALVMTLRTQVVDVCRHQQTPSADHSARFTPHHRSSCYL